MTKIKHKSPVSPTGVRRGERVVEGAGEDVSTHPAQGNFVLLRDGWALYGGDRYYRDGYAPQSAVKPEPVAEPEPAPHYQSGDRVRVLSTDTYGDEVPAGTVGTVVRDLGKGAFPLDVRLDGLGDGDYPFEYDEIEPHAEPTPLAVGDRVVYTVPETFMGEPGSRWATSGLAGELGTVTEAPYASGVRVRWDNAGSLRNSVEFVQRAPEYREVTYDNPFGGGGRFIGIQRTSDGWVAGFMAEDTPGNRAANADRITRPSETWLYTRKTGVQPL